MHILKDLKLVNNRTSIEVFDYRYDKNSAPDKNRVEKYKIYYLQTE